MEILTDLGQALIVTVLDTVSCSARPLVQHAITSAPKRAVVVSTSTHPPLSGDICARVDAGADPLGWEAGTADDGVSCGAVVAQRVVEGVREAARRASDDHVWVVVDSVSDLILQSGVHSVCDTVLRIRGVPKVKRVLLVAHGDLHDSSTVASLKYISDAIFDVRRGRYQQGSLMAVVEQEVGGARNDIYLGYADITHRRPQGKVVRTVKRILYPTEKKPLVFEDVEDPKNSKKAAESAPDPTANLTFKLNLTEEEKQAKNKVLLPYTHSDQEKDMILKRDNYGKGGGDGQIFYEADDGDDFDEEDPDDDLNV